ncbi:MFS general substrate transporter [Xylaria intraflava]|nr:MFS general substrate transporter [Xylaria intraflava]
MADSRRASSETIAPYTASPTTMGEDVEKKNRIAAATRSLDVQAEERYQPKSIKFWTVMISIFLSLFLVALDRTILGTATPQITQEFHSLGDIGWYGSAYQLTTAASQLLFGRVYKFYEVKRTFLITVIIFEVGSALCGAAPNSTAFIFGRAIAGLGSAGIFSGVTIILIMMVPLRKRPMFQGLFGTIFGLASVLGPLVGGALTDSATWRWCFYINLPIGAVAALSLIFFLPSTRIPHPPATLWEQVKRLDPLGTLLFIPSIASLLIALQWGGSKYAWGSWRIILLFVFFAVLLLAFVAVQVFMPKTATVPVRIISQRSILAATIFMFALAGSFLMAIYYLPLWFQVVKGVSATQSGINTLPFVLSLVVGSTLSGAFTAKVGYYVPAMILSPSLLAIGQGLMSTFRVDEPSANWIGYQFIAGFGLGLGMQSSNLAAQAVLPIPDVPIGIAIMFFAQQLGGGIFTSVGQNLLSSYLVSHLKIPGLAPEQITSQGATGLVSSVAPEFKPLVMAAYNKAISKIFICAMGVALVAVVAALFLEWKNVKKIRPAGAPPGTVPGARPGAPSGAGPEEEAGVGAEAGDQLDSMSEGEWPGPFGDSTDGSSPNTKTHGALFDVNEVHAPAPLRLGCEHCEHCRLSRALESAAPETQGLSFPNRNPPNYTGNAPSAEALEEAARLASIARSAVAQLEDLTRPYSADPPTIEGIPAQPQQAYLRRGSLGRQSLPGLPENPPPKAKRVPTTQDLVANAQRVSLQLEREVEVNETQTRREREEAASMPPNHQIGIAVSPISSRYSESGHFGTM